MVRGRKIASYSEIQAKHGRLNGTCYDEVCSHRRREDYLSLDLAANSGNLKRASSWSCCEKLRRSTQMIRLAQLSRVLHRVYWKRYVAVFGIGLIIANSYAFWPAFAYANTGFNCAVILGPVWFEVSGAAQVVGPPFYSEMQLVMHQGSTAYETKSYRSDNNNLTRLFENYPPPGSNPVSQYLYQIDGFTGLEYQNQVEANQTGVTITFQNITFQGIHVAKILSRIDVSNSAKDASYELGGPPCQPGLLLTVGSIPYAGPLAYEPAQLITVIISDAVALIGSTIACFPLTLHWNRHKAKLGKNENEVSSRERSDD